MEEKEKRGKKYNEGSMKLYLNKSTDYTFTLTLKKDFFGRAGARALIEEIEGKVEDWFEETKWFMPDFLVCLVDCGVAGENNDQDGKSYKRESRPDSKSAHTYQVDRWGKRCVVDVAVASRRLVEGKIPEDVIECFKSLKNELER